MRLLPGLTGSFMLPSLLCFFCPAATGAVQADEACPGGPPPATPGRAEPRFLDIDEPTAPGGTVRRRFMLRLPADYDPESRHPAVLDLHGYGSTAAIQHAYSGFAHIADEHSFIGVWPDGSGDCLGETPGCEHSWDDCSSCLQGWNCLGTSVGQGADGVQTCNPDRKAWGRYGCYASCGAVCEPREDNTTDTCVSSSCWDDIGFIDAVLDWLVANLCVDEERIHLSGLSNGAMMNYQLASSHVGHRIASMVPVAGLPLLGFLDPDQGPWSAVPVRPIALMDVHGMLDHVVPANVSNGFLGQPGPRGSTWSSDGFYYTPLDNVTQVYAQVNRCGERMPGAVYETAHDGELYWSCMRPFGECEETGASIVQCTSLSDHVWPVFEDPECESDECAFVEPIVSHISGSHCTDAINQLVETGDPFSTLEDACREALYKAILSTLMLCIVSYKKTPEILDMLKHGSTPASFDGASDDGRWSGLRCCGEWFSLIFLVSYHHHQEHPVVMWWEQLVLLLHCTVGMFFSMVENGIFEDEMNTFGSISVVGCFTWLLFAIELTGEAIWLLPMMSMVCLVPSDMIMVRYGHVQKETKDEKTGQMVPGKNVIDGDYASHGIYFMAICAVMLAVESALVAANNVKKAHKEAKSMKKKAELEKAIDKVAQKDK